MTDLSTTLSEVEIKKHRVEENKMIEMEEVTWSLKYTPPICSITHITETQMLIC